MHILYFYFVGQNFRDDSVVLVGVLTWSSGSFGKTK